MWRSTCRGWGLSFPWMDMEPWIRSWDDWMGARGDFCDYRDKDGLGRVYEVHRRSIHPQCASALRTSSQSEAFRIAPQMLGDLTGFGIGYFNFDESRGYVRTATEVSSDNSALMRNIRRHENALRSPVSDIAGAIMCVSRGYGDSIPDEGVMRVMFDDSIIQDTAAEKEQDMREVGVAMTAWRGTVPSGTGRTRRQLRHERRSWARKARLLRCERTNVNAAEQQSVSYAFTLVSIHHPSIYAGHKLVG